MPGRIRLERGPANAPWDSDGIRLRSQPETNLRSVGAHIRPTSGGSYYTYVKVTNDGTDPIGSCRCGTTGQWQAASLFVDSPTPTASFPVNAPDNRSRLVLLGATDQLELRDSAGQNIGGPWPVRGKTALGAQTGLNTFWGWSPDGLFFAVAVRDMQAGGGGTWWLYVYATRPYTRGDGTTQVPRGSIWSSAGTSTALNVIAGVNLGWNAASTCLVLAAPPMWGQSLTTLWLTLICPYADAASWQARAYTRPLTTGTQAGLQALGYQFLHSPCGGLFALVPKPGASPPPPSLQLELIDIWRTLATYQERQDNLPVGSATVNGAAATIQTASPGRRGIKLTLMSLTEIDNPECSIAYPTVVEVHRVRVTTNPNQIEYFPAGQASAAIWPRESLWVEFPQRVFTDPGGGQVHYCLQAMGDARPDDPSPGWQSFDLNDRHFAQRNIVFLP